MAPSARKLRRPRSAALWIALLCAAAAAAAFAPAAMAADGASSAPEPGATARAWARHTPVPILVYHHVQGYLAGNSYMYIGTSQFASQLRYLRSHCLLYTSPSPRD